MVGPSGLEPPTLRLSVVRSSQLSYGHIFQGSNPRGETPSKLNNTRIKRSDLEVCSFLSLHCLLRKEVIQPLVLERLPCYDVTPVIGFALGNFLANFGRPQLPWCDGRCVQGPGTYSPRHADPRLLAIPTSYRRVAACNPN